MRPEHILAQAQAPERTTRQMLAMGIQQMLVPILLQWETACAKPKDSQPVSADLIELYADSLASLNVTAAELKEARRSMLLSAKFFPTISEIAAWIKDNRHGRLIGYVECLDDEGNSWLAEKDRVLNGRLVDSGGNGVPCAPNAALADVIADINRKRAILGVKALTEATPEELESVGVVHRGGTLSLPSRNVHERPPMSPEKVAELEQEARETYERRKAGED